MITAPAWHVVYTYPNAEKKLYDRLLDKGLEAFLPIHKKWSIRSDRKKMIEAPLFPSYVFVKVNNATIDKVRYCKGFASFVQFEGKWATIGDDQIEMIKTVMASDVPYRLLPDSFAKEDDFVEVTLGALKGRQGRVKYIKQTKESCQVIMQVEHTGYALAVEVDRRCVRVLRNHMETAVV